MSEYCRIKDGKISEYISTRENLNGDDLRQVDGATFNGHVGMSKEWIDWDNGTVKPDKQLLSEGLIVDRRGIYISVDTKDVIEIKILNVDVPDGFIETMPSNWSDKWDGKNWLSKPSQLHEWDGKKWMPRPDQYHKWINSEWKEEDEATKGAMIRQEELSGAITILQETENDATEAIESGNALINSNPELYAQRKTARETIKRLSE